MPLNSLNEASISLAAGKVDEGAIHFAQAKFVLDRLLGMREEEVTEKDFEDAVRRFKALMAHVQHI